MVFAAEDSSGGYSFDYGMPELVSASREETNIEARLR